MEVLESVAAFRAAFFDECCTSSSSPHSERFVPPMQTLLALMGVARSMRAMATDHFRVGRCPTTGIYGGSSVLFPCPGVGIFLAPLLNRIHRRNADLVGSTHNWYAEVILPDSVSVAWKTAFLDAALKDSGRDMAARMWELYGRLGMYDFYGRHLNDFAAAAWQQARGMRDAGRQQEEEKEEKEEDPARHADLLRRAFAALRDAVGPSKAAHALDPLFKAEVEAAMQDMALRKALGLRVNLTTAVNLSEETVAYACLVDPWADALEWSLAAKQLHRDRARVAAEKSDTSFYHGEVLHSYDYMSPLERTMSSASEVVKAVNVRKEEDVLLPSMWRGLTTGKEKADPLPYLTELVDRHHASASFAAMFHLLIEKAAPPQQLARAYAAWRDRAEAIPAYRIATRHSSKGSAAAAASHLLAVWERIEAEPGRQRPQRRAEVLLGVRLPPSSSRREARIGPEATKFMLEFEAGRAEDLRVLWKADADLDAAEADARELSSRQNNEKNKKKGVVKALEAATAAFKSASHRAAMARAFRSQVECVYGMADLERIASEACKLS